MGIVWCRGGCTWRHWLHLARSLAADWLCSYLAVPDDEVLRRGEAHGEVAPQGRVAGGVKQAHILQAAQAAVREAAWQQEGT